MKFDKLHFGTAGIPWSAKGKGTAMGVERVNELGLSAMELEFVRSVNLNEKSAVQVKDVAKKNNIVLSCHGQYFVNMNGGEKIVAASKRMMIQAARIAWLASCFSITYHMAYYMKSSREEAYRNVKSNLKDILSKLKEQEIGIQIRPEIAGRLSQFGDLQECIKLSQELENVQPCIDFGHLHARTNGKNNSYEEFCKILEEIEKELGKEALEQMHIQVAGIAYNEKGERNHLNFEDSDFNYIELMRALKDFKVKGVVICESPNIEQDALLMQKIYRKIK